MSTKKDIYIYLYLQDIKIISLFYVILLSHVFKIKFKSKISWEGHRPNTVAVYCYYTYCNLFILNSFALDEIHDGMNIELYYQ